MAKTSRQAMRDLLKEVNQDLGQFFDSLNNELAAGTPVASGRARRGWRVTGNPQIGSGAITRVVIQNPVPYIAVLDQGTSRQAPNGIVEPAVRRTTRRYP